MATNYEDEDDVYLAKLMNLKPHSDNVLQLCKLEHYLSRCWNDIKTKSSLLKDCRKEREEMQEERKLYLERLEVLNDDLTKLEEAERELSLEAVEMTKSLQKAHSSQYLPLLGEVDHRWGTVEGGPGRTEEDGPTTSLTAEDIQSMRSLLTLLWEPDSSDHLPEAAGTSTSRRQTSGSTPDARRKRRSNQMTTAAESSFSKKRKSSSGNEPSSSTAVSSSRSSTSSSKSSASSSSMSSSPSGVKVPLDKAGVSHKHCPHCGFIIARNAVTCKSCHKPVTRRPSGGGGGRS